MLSLCLINQAPRHEDAWESKGIAPPFLTPALDGSEWSTSRFGPFTPGGNRLRYPLYRRLGGPQSLSGRCGVQNNLLPLPGIEPKPQPVAILTELSWLLSVSVVSSKLFSDVKIFSPENVCLIMQTSIMV
jgi:hypothetical protein